MNSTNVRLVEGGLTIAQGDFGSVTGFELLDENGNIHEESFNEPFEVILSTRDNNIIYTQKGIVSSSGLTMFTIDQNISSGIYRVHIKTRKGNIFPSDNSVKIRIIQTPFQNNDMIDGDNQQNQWNGEIPEDIINGLYARIKMELVMELTNHTLKNHKNDIIEYVDSKFKTNGDRITIIENRLNELNEKFKNVDMSIISSFSVNSSGLHWTDMIPDSPTFGMDHTLVNTSKYAEQQGG